MVHLITGYAGHGHVTAADDALYHSGVCGTGKYVMRTGTMFAASVESSNEITIGSGDLVNQGRHINIPTNATEKATINNGTQGKTRKDVIAIRYKQDASTGVESAELIVLQGASVNTGQTPARPALKSGNLYEGDTIDDFPLYEVTLNNLNITAVTKLFAPLPTLSGMFDLIYPVGAIYMSASSTNPANLFGGTWEEIQGKFLLARDGNHAAGTTGGSENVTLTTEQIPAHSHIGGEHTHTGPLHTHTINSHGHTASCASAGAHSHNVDRNKNAASGTARYAAQAAKAKTTHGTSSNGAHTHGITIGGSGTLTSNAAGTGNTGSGGAVSTSNTGGGREHSNMPPYLAVYVWKRTK